MCSSRSLIENVSVILLVENDHVAFQESILNNSGQKQYWLPKVSIPRDMIKGICNGTEVTITILMSGMRRFEGSFTKNFELNGESTLFIKNKQSNQFTLMKGVLNGIYCEFNEKGERVKSIMFANGKKQSVINGRDKLLKDERQQGSGLFGECCDSSDMAWNGLVFKFKNNRPVKVSFYQDGDLVYNYGCFEEKNGTSLFVQFTEDNQVQYCGEYLIDEKEGCVYYHGYGILFGVDKGRFGCIYKGNFNRGNYNGFGSSYDMVTGLKKEEGIWEDGVLKNGDTFIDGVLKNNMVSELGHFAALGNNPGKVLVENGPLSKEMSDAVFHQGPITRSRVIVCDKDALKEMRSFKIMGYPNLDELVLSEDCLSKCEQVVIESD